MVICLQANVLINEQVCTQDLFDSYGFKTYMNYWVYSLGQRRPGVTLAE